MDSKPLSICSYNVHNFHKRSVRPMKFAFMQSLLSNHTFLCIQEHWLYESNIKSVIGELKQGCNVIGCSPMNEDVQRIGRPYGGCAIVWESSADFAAEQIPCANKRVCALDVKLKSGVHVLILNVYMPFDDGLPQSLVDYREVVNDVNQLISERDPDEVAFLGDMNASFSRDSPAMRDRCSILGELQDIFELQCLTDQLPYTFCDTQGRNSVVDHCFVSKGLHQKLVSCSIVDNVIHSDHAPVSISFDIDIPYLPDEERVFVPRTAWYKASKAQLNGYSSALFEKLDSIDITCDALQCTDVQCKAHNDTLVEIYDYIVDSHLECADEFIPKSCAPDPSASDTVTGNIPGWNDFVKDLHEEALFWHCAWVNQGRPHQGDFFEARKQTRARYHLAVRRCKSDEDKIRMEKMAEAMLKNDSRNFWLEAKKFRGGTKSFPRKVDDARCQKDIAELFMDKYSVLYNSVSYEEAEFDELCQEVESDVCPGMSFVFPKEKILDQLRSLPEGKSGGPESVSSDHIINGPLEKLAEVLATLFTALLTHGVCPPSLASGTLSPIPKGKKSAESSDSWRQIALSSVFGKVLDKVFLSSENDKLVSTDLQYAYKRGFSTSQCTFNLMETISYYNLKKTTVYVVLLDASRAFDRVNLVKLFRELRSRGVNPLVIRFLLSMYAIQCLSVKWRNTETGFFPATNGVRQGGVHSPIFFTVYVDCLFQRLAKSGLGCYMGSIFVGCLGFADDVALVAPTVNALSHLVSISVAFAEEFDILFNGSKSKFLVFRHAGDLSSQQSIQIGPDTIVEVLSDVHLGHRLDTADMAGALVKEAKGSFWASVNKLLGSFGAVRPDILSRLFSAYCTSFYGSPLWNYKSYVEVANTWRTALKRVWDLPRETHRELVALVSSTLPLEVSLRKRFCKFTQSGLGGPSKVTGSIMRLVRGNHLSTFNSNINHIVSLYGFDLDEYSSLNFDAFFRDGWRRGVPGDLHAVAAELRGILLSDVRGEPRGTPPAYYEHEREELVALLATM